MSNPLFNNDDFDKNFDRHFTNVEKTIKRTWIVMIILWIVGGICSLALTGGAIWMAWHFISKVW